METEIMDAFMILQLKSCGLEEIFLTAGSDMHLSEDDEEYARNACKNIIKALDLIRSDV